MNGLLVSGLLEIASHSAANLESVSFDGGLMPSGLFL
jgi:hypothetical protein